MMTDNIIRSMKDQMVPSDDVVSDLLAKISALEASPDTTADGSKREEMLQKNKSIRVTDWRKGQNDRKYNGPVSADKNADRR